MVPASLIFKLLPIWNMDRASMISMGYSKPCQTTKMEYIAKMGNRWKPLTIFVNRVLDKPLNFRIPTFFLTSNVSRFLGILGEVLSKLEKNLVNYRLNHKCFKIFLKNIKEGFIKSFCSNTTGFTYYICMEFLDLFIGPLFFSVA